MQQHCCNQEQGQCCLDHFITFKQVANTYKTLVTSQSQGERACNNEADNNLYKLHDAITR